MTLDFYKNKRIFITGHTGFKGTWLCHILLNTGATVTGYALNPPTNPSLYNQTFLENRINSTISDIRNRECLFQSMNEAKPDIVFHLASQPIVRRSYLEPTLTYEINVMGTVNILEATRSVSSVKSFVNITTDKVYENNEWHWGYRENEKLCGYDPYSNSKSCSELVTYCYRNSFFNNDTSPAISTARSGNTIGGGDYAEDRIMPDCIKAAESGTNIIIRNPNSIRPYQHVLDCLSGYLTLAEKQYNEKKISGSYNFGPDEENCISTEDLTRLFCENWGSNVSWKVQNENGPHEANFLKLDCSKAKSVLGWKPKWDIKTAIEKTINLTKKVNNDEKLNCLNNQINEYFNK